MKEEGAFLHHRRLPASVAAAQHEKIVAFRADGKFGSI